MNITGLRAFHAVAEAGSFTRAAAATGLSQPTLSSQVQMLEKQHDASLFDRKGRSVGLTGLGLRLFDVTTRLFAVQMEAQALLEGSRTLQRGHLRIAADSGTHVMPVLAALKQSGTRLTFSLSIDNSTRVLAQLLDYSADIAIMSRNTSDPRIHSLKLRTDRVILFVPSNHALAGKRHGSISDLQGQELVIREPGSVTREIFETRLAERGIKPGLLFEVQGREAVREAVASGFGIGIVFESELGNDPGFRPVILEDVDLSVAEYVTCLEARRRLPLVRRFFEVAESLKS
jgi:LysR family transcriptional regulator, low CO2-responsive transcriptional regulator